MKKSFSLYALMVLFVLGCHSKKVAKTQTSSVNKPVVKSDSLVCNGVSSAFVSVLNTYSTNGKIEYYFRDLKNGDTLIVVKQLTDATTSEAVNYDHYYFPPLKRTCDVINKTAGIGIKETVCKFKLTNKQGLDTFRVETFITLNGSYKKKVEANKTNLVNFAMAERNRGASIYFIGNDIYQDSLIIGSYDESVMNVTRIGNINQIQVYNKQSQIICFASETTAGSHEWRLATNQDGKYHLLKVDALKNKDLNVIISFLISSSYL